MRKVWWDCSITSGFASKTTLFLEVVGLDGTGDGLARRSFSREFDKKHREPKISGRFAEEG
jgi:hypothetical protein